MSTQNQIPTFQSHRSPSGMPPQALPQAFQPSVSTTSTITTPIAQDFSPGAVGATDDGDYFGQTWSKKTTLKKANISARSPSSQYSPHSQRSRMKPGAKNSFARSSPVQSEMRATRDSGSVRRSSANAFPDSQHLFERSQLDSNLNEDYDEDLALAAQELVPRPRRKKTPSQKAMLSQALQKANQAVVLDNAQNFAGAVQAYDDACELLQQVMLRSSGDEERRKLDAIRNTYKNRIKELRTNELSTYHTSDKALPDVPAEAGRIGDDQPRFSQENGPEPHFKEDGIQHISSDYRPEEDPRAMNQHPRPLHQQSIPPAAYAGTQSDHIAASQQSLGPQNSWKQDSQKTADSGPTSASFSSPMDKHYMPPPLSPHRPSSPSVEAGSRLVGDPHQRTVPSEHTLALHSRQATAESTSWLDTIDESGGSSSSSVHSRSSSIGFRRKHIRAGSGATEAEFDAALDAAVEAAYDDGYEPVSGDEDTMNYDAASMPASESYFTSAKRNIDLARQRVRDAEREAAIMNARERERRRRLKNDESTSKTDGLDVPYEENEADEEERMLEEMTREYILDEVDHGFRSTKAVPRKSDSSGLSGRTWGSSTEPIPMTTGTGLSIVAKYGSSTLPMHSQNANLLNSRTYAALPVLAQPSFTSDATPYSSTNSILITGSTTGSSPGVRERRLSGQKVKQLKIDTKARLPLASGGPKTQPPMISSPPLLSRPYDNGPRSASLPLGADNDTNLMKMKFKADSLLGQADRGDTREQRSNSLVESQTEPMLSTTSLPLTNSKEAPLLPTASSPVRPPSKVPSFGALRKNYSSSSLKSLKQQTISTPGTEDSPGTPNGRAFPAFTNQRSEVPPVMPDLPTPSATSVGKGGSLSSSLSFFDSDIHSTIMPGSPNAGVSNAPVPLEACPESFLLRPFWLMRAIYQTIAHPRGGYISTRLFVPRDAWRVKNVKLKNLDEKVANCDLLTAALLNLQKVDTLDADAVLEEMQAFELILDQVQGQLGKKLGAEVGIGGSAAIFRATPVVEEAGSADGLGLKLGSTSSKSYLSWKRLRSKHSPGPAVQSAVPALQHKENLKDGLTMSSLPMTAAANPRFAKRDPTKVLGIGPHSHYMSALGRLCDAVQILDQIARQVEDPGLRPFSQTHVGLELCIRHAAEFFAFFICRFALSDIGMMLDKFVKRGSEWVLA